MFSRSDLGKGGQENQKPASQICHRLWSRTQLSKRGRHPENRRVRRRRAAPGPFLYLGSPARPPSRERPPPSPLPASQGFAKGCARLPRVPPLSHPSRRPRSEKLTPEVPGKAGVGGAGASVRPGAGLRSPAPSGSPTGSSYCCSLTLPPSLSQVARSVPVTWAGSRMVPHGRAPCALRRGSKRH